ALRRRAARGRAARHPHQFAPARGRAARGREASVKLAPSRSLRAKLISVILLTTLASLVVAISAIVALDLRAYDRTLAADMSTQAELLGRMSATSLAFDDPKVAEANLALLH